MVSTRRVEVMPCAAMLCSSMMIKAHDCALSELANWGLSSAFHFVYYSALVQAGLYSFTFSTI